MCVKNVIWAVRRAEKISSEELGYVLEAAAWLLLARIMVVSMRLPRLKAVVGFLVPVERMIVRQDSGKVVNMVSRMVARLPARMPGSYVCLSQSIAARFMLGARGIGIEVCVGMAKGNEGTLRGHAWTTCGITVVTGEAGREDCEVLLRF